MSDTPNAERVFIDGRCHCERCVSRTTAGYRMVGSCRNCGVEALVLYRAGDPSAPVKCPTCGNTRSVYTTRLATPDEIPAR